MIKQSDFIAGMKIYGTHVSLDNKGRIVVSRSDWKKSAAKAIICALGPVHTENFDKLFETIELSAFWSNDLVSIWSGIVDFDVMSE